MEIDLSRIFYDKYFGLSNRNIKVTMEGGSIFKGVIVGFFKGDEDNNEPYIVKWHIVPESRKIKLGMDGFGIIKGEFIETNDIVKVNFYSDNSVILFKNASC